MYIKCRFSYPPESSTLAFELAGFRISVIVVLVVFKDFEVFITGRRKLLATIYTNAHMLTYHLSTVFT